MDIRKQLPATACGRLNDHFRTPRWPQSRPRWPHCRRIATGARSRSCRFAGRKSSKSSLRPICAACRRAAACSLPAAMRAAPRRHRLRPGGAL